MIWFAPGEKHWHGATPTTAVTHIAIQEALNGKAVDWMEKVSDEQYGESRVAGNRRPEVRGQRSEVRSRRSEVRGHREIMV